MIAVVILLSIGCDQGTKALAEEHLAGQGTLRFLDDIVRLHYSENPGALLSLGAQLPEAARFLIFVVFVAVVLGLLLLYLLRDRRMRYPQIVGLSLILGGGISNLIDRIVNDGLVIDFLNLGIANLRTGIFNLADVAVFAGVGLFWLAYAQEPEAQAEEAEETEDIAPTDEAAPPQDTTTDD